MIGRLIWRGIVVVVSFLIAVAVALAVLFPWMIMRIIDNQLVPMQAEGLLPRVVTGSSAGATTPRPARC